MKPHAEIHERVTEIITNIAGVKGEGYLDVMMSAHSCETILKFVDMNAEREAIKMVMFMMINCLAKAHKIDMQGREKELRADIGMIEMMEAECRR